MWIQTNYHYITITWSAFTILTLEEKNYSFIKVTHEKNKSKCLNGSCGVDWCTVFTWTPHVLAFLLDGGPISQSKTLSTFFEKELYRGRVVLWTKKKRGTHSSTNSRVTSVLPLVKEAANHILVSCYSFLRLSLPPHLYTFIFSIIYIKFSTVMSFYFTSINILV